MSIESKNRCVMAGKVMEPPVFGKYGDNALSILTVVIEVPLWNTKTSKITVKAFSKLADEFKDKVKQGEMIEATGKMSVRNWKDKTDNWRTSAELNAEVIEVEEAQQESPAQQEPARGEGENVLPF